MTDVQNDGQLADDVKVVLGGAGWREEQDRSVDISKWVQKLGDQFVLFPAARKALGRFGGIRVEQSGSGESAARQSFELDPSLAIGEEDRFDRFGKQLGKRLFPLGEAGQGHVFLAISEDGRIFALMDEIWLVGETMESALEALIRGRRLRHLQL